MSVEFTDREEKARDKKYILKCKVHVRDITYEDYQSSGALGLVTEKMLFLEPLESTQRDLFFFAWLPEYKWDDKKKEAVPGHSEVMCLMGNPVNGYFRCALHRLDERFRDGHYLFVMSKAAEEDLKQMDGREIVLEVLGQTEEQNVAGEEKDYELGGRSKF